MQDFAYILIWKNKKKIKKPYRFDELIKMLSFDGASATDTVGFAGG